MFANFIAILFVITAFIFSAASFDALHWKDTFFPTYSNVPEKELAGEENKEESSESIATELTETTPNGQERTQTAIDKVVEKVASVRPPVLRAGETSSAALSQNIRSAEVLKWTNYYRAQENLPALSRNPTLDTVAIMKMNDMFKQGYFEHVSPDGTKVADLARGVGYEFVSVGENLALGDFASEKELVDAWMASPGHRENIMKKNYEEIGLAVGVGIFEGRRTLIAVQEFGRPASACPEPRDSLNIHIDANRVKMENLKLQINALRAEIESGTLSKSMYSQKVKEYNMLVEEYNVLAEETGMLINEFNIEAGVYNACIKE